MFATLAALFFAMSLVGACAIIACSLRQNIDAVIHLLKDYAEIGGASPTAIVSAQMITSLPPKITPFDGTFVGLSPSLRKPARSYRKGKNMRSGDGQIMPSAQRVAA